MARRRKNIEAFSLSFLDCICCGFGAIILLLVLSKIYEPVVVEESEQNLEQLIALLQEELFNLRGETTVLDRELKKVREDASSTQLELAQLQGDLNKVRGQYEASQQEEEATIDEGELSAARQRLTEEMKRLLPYYRRSDADAVAGIPVDSEYIIFVIDTSNSMINYNWGLVQRKLREVAVETNRIHAQILGINQSASVTCVKPSGNSSQLLNSSSGLHSRWAPYYVRNVRISGHSPVLKVLRDAGVPMDPGLDPSSCQE